MGNGLQLLLNNISSHKLPCISVNVFELVQHMSPCVLNIQKNTELHLYGTHSVTLPQSNSKPCRAIAYISEVDEEHYCEAS